MATSQASRTVQIKTPLGTDALLLTHFSAHEQVSRLFEYDLQLLSDAGDLNADKILGQPVTVKFQLPDKAGNRFFNGFVTEFSQTGYEERHHRYQATVRPWFWFLTRTSDCRIFQGKTIPDIFQAVVGQYGFSDFKLKLSGSYSPRDYCVQYRETDFNFLSRLLEFEGIYYFFEHEDGKHLMILADDANAHSKFKGYETVPYYPPSTPDVQRERDHLTSWIQSKSVQSGAYATTDYDFSAPKKSLLQSSSISKSHAQSKFEIYDYPAELGKLDSGETSRVAKVRIQEIQATQTIASGEGDAAGLATGYAFSLAKYPRADLNIEYFIIGSTISLTSDAHMSGGADPGTEFAISLQAIDAKTPYRPQRSTPKPVVQGAQTAIVVGAGGDEIYTDKYGRVKVQFPWDRQGKNDENSGCWIRVAQVWAGKQWGAMHIPRIGQEVIVSFLEGDPDQPIITGRVYNGANMPPYDLPANKTQSGIKSRSSKDGSPANFNELRFEDKIGSELVTIHAEKDNELTVEHDETHTVGNDETHKVGHDETEAVGHDQSLSVGNDRSKTVEANETVSVGKNRTETVNGNESITIGKNRDEGVGGNESVAVGKNQSLAVTADQSITVGGGRSMSVGKDESITVSGKRQDTVGKDEEISVAKNRSVNVGENDELAVGKKLTIDAADEIVMKTGDASITMKKDGTITIKGKDITLDGSGKVNVKASSDVTIKGSKVSAN
jgi:type VI secretion system secreted protein VgrG